MNEYVAALRKYATDNPPNYGSDAHSILDEIHAVLTQAYVELAIPMPWTGDFDEFMSNRNNKLIFGRREDV